MVYRWLKLAKDPLQRFFNDCIVYCSLDTYLHLQHRNIFKTVTWYGWIEVKSVRIARKNWGNNYISVQHISDSEFHVFISPQQSTKWQKRIPTLTIHIVHTRTDYGNFFNLIERSISWNNLPSDIRNIFSSFVQEVAKIIFQEPTI